VAEFSRHNPPVSLVRGIAMPNAGFGQDEWPRSCRGNEGPTDYHC